MSHSCLPVLNPCCLLLPLPCLCHSQGTVGLSSGREKGNGTQCELVDTNLATSSNTTLMIAFDCCLLFLPGSWLQKEQMVIRRVGSGEGRASCSDMRRAQLPISNRDILTFGILSEVYFLFPAPLSAQTQCAEKTAEEGLERQVWSVSAFYFFFKALTSIFSSAFLQQLELKRGRQESFIPTAGACSKHLKLQNSLKREWESASLGKSGSVSL